MDFIQDQSFYLTLAVAALSVMIAGTQTAWSQRAEPARELLKGLSWAGPWRSSSTSSS